MPGTVALQVIPDRFSGIAKSLAASTSSSYSTKGTPFIRRPTRGIVLKGDTFATIRVAIASSGGSQLLVDAGSKRKDVKSDLLEINGKRATDIYSNFLLQQVQEDRMEKQQILETFGEPFIFLFGERARVINFAGILANTFDFNWEAEWWYNYENYLRGTRCVENDARVFITFDNTIVGGYIISTNSTKTSQERNFVNFQFQMFVTSYSNFSAIGNDDAFSGSEGFPGSGITADTVDGQIITEAAAKPFRPVLLDSTISTQNIGALNGPTTLFEGFEDTVGNALQTVSNTWNSADQIVNNVLSGINSLMNGDNVRVPYGFAGTMAFDSEADVKLSTVQFGTAIKYTVFSDNFDEYVGTGDQYGTSDPKFASNLSIGNDLSVFDDAFNQDLVETATDIWASEGYPVPDTQLGPVSRFIVSKSLGLLAVGASSAWTSFSHTTTPGSAGGAFAKGLGGAVGLPE